MRLTSTLLFLLFSSAMFAQALPILEDEYTWKDSVDYHAMVPENVEGDAYTLLHDRTLEYNFAADQNIYCFYFTHKVIYLNSEQGVEDQNKIYLSLDNAIELMDYNARVINADGKVTLLGKDALQEGTTEEGVTYNYFAIAGAEKGSVVEFYYLLKKYPNFSGNWAVMQNAYPTARSKFRIVAPWFLVFETFGLNGFNALRSDTAYDDRRVLAMDTVDLPKAPDDQGANNSAHTMKLLYQLDDNLASEAYNIYNYGILSQSIFETLGGSVSKKEDKAIAKWLADADLGDPSNAREYIYNIEKHAKENIEVIENSDQRLNDIASMLATGYASEYGLTRLLFLSYKSLEVPMEIVMTCNRYDLKFDPEIESYAFLSSYLFYFPKIKDYILPGSNLYRLGVIPFGFIHNHGLFIREIAVGGVVTGAGKVRYIEPYGAEHTKHDMMINVSFGELLDSIHVDMKQEMTGYDASNIQPFFDYIPEDNLEEFEESILKLINENITIKSIAFENKGDEHLMKDPLIVDGTYSSSEFLELAGNKVLFKMGELIGPQAEMYQEEKRTLPVETTHNHRYFREITFALPEGYSCSNLSDINLDVRPFEDKEAAGFTSSFTQDGNNITIKVDEYYDRMDFTLEEFEDYRSVINAAADFNKIVLVFEKG